MTNDVKEEENNYIREGLVMQKQNIVLSIGECLLSSCYAKTKHRCNHRRMFALNSLVL